MGLLTNDIGPRYCPACRQRMVKETELGIMRAITCEIQRITGFYIDKWVCRNDYKPNDQKIKLYEQKYSNDFSYLEKKYKGRGRECVNFIKKNGFSGRESQLDARFGSGLKKLSGRIREENGNNSGKRFSIPKEPPKYICCENHYKFIHKGQYNEVKSARPKELLWCWDFSANKLVKYKPYILRMLFPD